MPHPLADNPRWLFTQPDLGFRSHYVAVSPDGSRELRVISSASTCREATISNVRGFFRNFLTNFEEYEGSRKKGWDKLVKIPRKLLKTVDLDDPATKKEPAVLRIRWTENPVSGIPVGKFLQVCDTVMGPLMVLFAKSRPVGDLWWAHDPSEQMIGTPGEQYACWRGSDNWFLNHPVTFAIALGLYRQCYHLCQAGLADEIIASVNPKDIGEVMTTNNRALALNLIKQTRPYIEVPAGEGGLREHYPFALGFWRRLMRFQRAVNRVGYAEALGQDFATGWGLLSDSEEGNWKGVYMFWGDDGELTDRHRHLMVVGAPRRKLSGKKVARRAS